jgi:hypothetical protein
LYIGVTVDIGPFGKLFNIFFNNATNTIFTNFFIVIKRFANKIKGLFLKYFAFFTINPLFKILIICYLLVYLLNIILLTINTFYYYEFNSDNLGLYMTANNSVVPTPPSDPVRWWPSGVPQAGISVASGIGTYLALQKAGFISPRGRVIGALAAAGVTTSHIAYNTALKNSVGFNRLMWGWSEYNATGKWPSVDQAYAKKVSDLKAFELAKLANLSPSEQAKIDATVKSMQSSSSTSGTMTDLSSTSGTTTDLSSTSVTTFGSSDFTNNFIPSSNSPFESCFSRTQLYETLFKNIMVLFQPSPVMGHFDDLVGQRMFIQFILFMSCIFVIILFILFIFNLIFVFNKDKILNYFKNKFIL